MLPNEKPDLITVLRRRKRELEQFVEDLVNKGLTEEELKEKLEKEYKIHPAIADRIKKAAKPKVEQEEAEEPREELVQEEEKPKRRTRKKKTEESTETKKETSDTYEENQKPDSETNLEGETNDVEQDQE